MSQHGDHGTTPNQEEFTTQCIKAIEDYRGQSITRWETITTISDALLSATASTNSGQRSTARGTYLGMLDEHDRLVTRAQTRGLQRLVAYNEEMTTPKPTLLERMGIIEHPLAAPLLDQSGEKLTNPYMPGGHKRNHSLTRAPTI